MVEGCVVAKIGIKGINEIDDGRVRDSAVKHRVLEEPFLRIAE